MEHNKYDEITGEQFLRRIDETLMKRFLSRKQLASACEFSVQNMSRWRTLGSLPDVKCGIRIADFLDVPLYWLITGEMENNKLQMDELNMLEGFRKLDENDKNVIKATLNALLKKYIHAGFEGHLDVN